MLKKADNEGEMLHAIETLRKVKLSVLRVCPALPIIGCIFDRGGGGTFLGRRGMLKDSLFMAT